jgi:hypothetical protein
VRRDFLGITLQEIAEGVELGLDSLDQDAAIHLAFNAPGPSLGFGSGVETAILLGVTLPPDVCARVVAAFPDARHLMRQTILVAFVSGAIFDCAAFAPNGVVRELGSAAGKEKGPQAIA